MDFMQSFASEIAIAAMTAVSLLVVKLVRDYTVNRKYRLSGSYLSRFQDREGENEFIQKSTLTLKQKGARVVAKDKTDLGRAWRLSGRIYNSNRVCGIYYAEANHDESVGSFFFTLEYPDLFGVWSGYDNMNKRPDTGWYSLTRMASVKIAKLPRKDMDVAMRIADETEVHALAPTDVILAANISERTLGPGFMNRESFTPNYGENVIIGAYESGNLVGFGVTFLMMKGLLGKVIYEGHNYPETPPQIRDADVHGTLGVIKTVAVSPDGQGRGIGTKIIQNAEEKLAKKGARILMVPAWERGDGNLNIGGVLDHLGYEQWGRIDNFWKTQCDSGEFNCPEREKCDQCVCNIVFFAKAVK